MQYDSSIDYTLKKKDWKKIHMNLDIVNSVSGNI